MPETVSAAGPIDHFAAAFRQEHRELRDVILGLIAVSQKGDRDEARRLVARLSELAGPHFRYEEERLYPALVEFFGVAYVESLCSEHDGAIVATRRLSELAQGEVASESDRETMEAVARGLLPHISDCEGLSIMVECLPEPAVARILDARRRARDENLGLLQWADGGRLRPSVGA